MFFFFFFLLTFFFRLKDLIQYYSTFGTVCLFIKRKLINHICFLQEDTLAMRKEIEDLRTNARIFQLSKCTACTFTLDLPAVHFMCMHSFHQRCLGDNEKECPECAPDYRKVLEMKRSLEQNKDQDLFFQQVKSSKDGFSVIAQYFGKGIISKTSNLTMNATNSENQSSTNGFEC